MRRLRVVLIPPQRLQPERDRYIPGVSPSEGEIDYLMSLHHNIDVELLDPYSFPFNLFGNAHPLLQGLDIARALRILVTRRNVDLVISMFESSTTFLLLFRKLARFRPKVAIWDLVTDEEWKVRKTIQNLVIPRTDHTFLLSSEQQNYIERRWGVGSKTSIVWQHVDTEYFKPTATAVNVHGPVFAIGDDHGRDWNTFIEAVADLDIDVIIKTRHKINRPDGMRCRLKQISHRLTFAELRDLYAQSSIVVIPLKTTLNVSGVGSVLESMSMGKALIISDNPPIRDYLVANETCRIVPVGNSKAMQLAIEQLLASPEEIERLGSAARLRALFYYSKPAFAKRFAEQIRQIIDHSS